MDDLSAKVFRTYNASHTLQNELADCSIDPEKDTVEAKVKFYEAANRKVAVLCNHLKSVPKTHQASMEKAQQLIQEKKDRVAKL
jgi:DNA topoisomerase I